MTNFELITKLEQAQYLLSEIYAWAGQPRALGSYLPRNETLRDLMSAADSCICEALDELEHNE
jgi:hypothetical protein